MANRSPFNWIIEKLDENDKVLSTKIDQQGILYITRVEGEQLRLISSPLETFNLSDIKPLADLDNIDFILHTFKEPFISGDVFQYLDLRKKVLGGFGDVINIVDQRHNWPYFPRDVHFIKRGLEQHTRVSKVIRLDSRRYQVFRPMLGDVTIIALYDYEIGIEAVREAVATYGPFDIILKANPYGDITTQAFKLSKSLNIKILKWGQLLGRLNEKWV